MLIPSVKSINGMINLFSFSTWFFFLVCFVGQIYLRFKQPDLHRPFKVFSLFNVISLDMVNCPNFYVCCFTCFNYSSYF